MKKAVLSLAAVLMLIGSFAAPSFAAGNSNTASNDKCTIRLGGPSTVAAGQAALITGSISLTDDGTSARKPVIYELGISSNGGPIERIPLRSGVKSFRAGATKTTSRSITINEHVTPGEYTLYFAVTVDGSNLVVSLPITITK